MAKSIDWVSMRVRFLNSDCTLKEFAEQNGISYSIVRTKASQGKWLKERDTLSGNQIHNKGGEHLIRQLSSLLILVKEALLSIQEIPNYFYKSDGSPNLSKIHDFLQIYRQLEERIRSSYDVLPLDAQKKLELSISSFDLKKTIYNQNDEAVTTDNFIEALESAAEKLWQTEPK